MHIKILPIGSLIIGEIFSPGATDEDYREQEEDMDHADHREDGTPQESIWVTPKTSRLAKYVATSTFQTYGTERGQLGTRQKPLG